MIIAAAQTVPLKGNVDYNIDQHLNLIQEAHTKNVNIIVFPELSLTGYEPELAKELAFTLDDERLNPLIQVSKATGMVIIVGGPLKILEKLHIGSFIIDPDGTVLNYTKRYLYPGEEKFFDPGEIDHQINLMGEKISLAICADISNPEHPKSASGKKATMYLSSVLCTPKGYDKDVAMLKQYAIKYGMHVMMVNFGGDSGVYEVAGKSIIISKNGETVTSLPGKGLGLAIAKLENNQWFVDESS